MQLRLDAADRLVELVEERRGPVAAEEAACRLFALRRAPAGLARSLLAEVVDTDARLSWRGDTVARLTAVIAPDGLVGRIVDVRAGSSVVQVLTDPASTVGAHVVRTRTPGIIEGEPRGTLRFKYMARDGSGIQVGDVVVTSGLGGLFPGGIPIGRVRTIDDRGSALFSYAQVTPAVDFARIDEVLLLTGGAARDVAASFRSDG